MVGAGDVQLAPPNPRRVSILIGTPKTAVVWISLAGAAAVGKGIALRPGTAPLQLSRTNVNDSIHEEIHAVSDGVPEAIGVWDFFG